MDSRPVVTDPYIRLELAAAWIKRERRLMIGLLVAALVAIAVWMQLGFAQSVAWQTSEVENMSGLPLKPEGAAAEDGVTAEEDAVFTRLQEEMRKQPRPDLVDGRSNK